MVNFKKRVYVAGPLFTQAEWRWNMQLGQELKELGFDVFLPQKGAEPMLNGEVMYDPRALFLMNLAEIDKADVVLAVLDQAEPDSGTSWECGYAYKAGHPVVGLRTDIRKGGDDADAGINLMLSKSCTELIVVPLDKRENLSWVVQRVAETLNNVMERSKQ